jgi:hypothetical protein
VDRDDHGGQGPPLVDRALELLVGPGEALVGELEVGALLVDRPEEGTQREIAALVAIRRHA